METSLILLLLELVRAFFFNCKRKHNLNCFTVIDKVLLVMFHVNLELRTFKRVVLGQLTHLLRTLLSVFRSFNTFQDFETCTINSYISWCWVFKVTVIFLYYVLIM